MLYVREEDVVAWHHQHQVEPINRIQEARLKGTPHS